MMLQKSASVINDKFEKRETGDRTPLTKMHAHGVIRKYQDRHDNQSFLMESSE